MDEVKHLSESAHIATQGLQRILHSRLIMPALRGKTVQPPRVLGALLRRVPSLAAVPAYVIGVGLRPEKAPAWARPSTAPDRSQP